MRRLSRAFSAGHHLQVLASLQRVELLVGQQTVDQDPHRGKRRAQLVRDSRDEIGLHPRQLQVSSQRAGPPEPMMAMPAMPASATETYTVPDAGASASDDAMSSGMNDSCQPGNHGPAAIASASPLHVRWKRDEHDPGRSDLVQEVVHHLFDRPVR